MSYVVMMVACSFSLEFNLGTLAYILSLLSKVVILASGSSLQLQCIVLTLIVYSFIADLKLK